MYSPKITAWQLGQASKVYASRDEHSGEIRLREWKRHTVQQVDANNAWLNDLWEGTGWKRPLTPEESDYMLNERVLSTCDYEYFATRYAFIKNWENQIVHYRPNIAQQILNHVRAELEERKVAIDIQALKARQLGISTDTEICGCHRLTFYEGVNGVVGSSDPDKSWKMSQMMELVWERMPFWLRPTQTKYKAGELIEFGLQNCTLTIQHGTQRQGIARGDTPTFAHLSELADFENPQQLVDAALLRAMHESPYLLITLESTAKGRHNWWHKTWEHSKEHWPRNESRHYPLFLPWFVGQDIYPTETWIRAHPIREHWEPSSLTLNHAERSEAYARVNPLLRKFLGADWQMPLEQMWYWELQRQEALEKGTLHDFYSEMPADDEEAFQNTNISVFDAETLSAYRESTKQMPVSVYGIVGSENDIPRRLWPDRRDVDQNIRPLTIVYRSPTGVKKTFQFQPLKFEGYSNCDPFGKLFIWEHPVNDEEYGFGVDTGEGLGLDRSVIEVMRKGTLTRNDAQVAEFCSPYLNAHDLSPISLAVGAYFSNYYNGEPQQPKAIIECMQNGETVQHNLRLYGWANFHRWVRYDKARVSAAGASRLGVIMVPWYRSMMMDTAIKYLKDGWVDINSPWFVSEMADLERDESRTSMRAMYGGNDDRFMALGNCLFCMHDLELRGPRQAAHPDVSVEFSRGRAPEYSPPQHSGELYDDQILSSGFRVTDEEEGYEESYQ